MDSIKDLASVDIRKTDIEYKHLRPLAQYTSDGIYPVPGFKDNLDARYFPAYAPHKIPEKKMVVDDA
jgi:hypothetical protein